MFVIKILTFGFILFFLSSCNKNMSDDQKKEMWSKAQTTGEIYKRSGSKLPNSTANQKAKAMRDAETRLVTGGGLFGKDGLDFKDVLSGNNQNVVSGNVGMPINPYLWKASL